MPDNPAFLNFVVGKGILNEQDAKELNEQHPNNSYALLNQMIRKGLIKKNESGALWGDSIGFPYIELTKTLFQPHIVEKLPEKLARKYQIIPIYQFGDTITLATENPTNTVLLREAANMMGCPVSPVFAFPDEINDAIDIEYQSKDFLQQLTGKINLEALLGAGSEISPELLTRIAGDQAVIDFTRAVMLLAIKEKASDIHLEPSEENVRIRFRIDGLLQEKLKLAKSFHAPLVSRLKILANLNIAERRRPQDGRLKLDLSHKSIDFRFSAVPTIYGEKVVLRILGQVETQNIPDLTELGFSKLIYDQAVRVCENPQGIFFVTGPTGSGKSTTLYSLLQSINKPDINIMTIEDPVEYRLAGINQIQANAQVELDFAGALRSFLRQDPDVILVGEIRDLETARIATQAALTGHLVFATLHTNDSVQAIARMLDIGVEPFLIAPSVIAVMAQRLVRKICEYCKEKYLISAEETARYFDSDGDKEIHFYRGKGCRFCNNTGYSGRVGIHEIFVIGEETRGMIGRGATVLELKTFLKKEGFRSMRYDGIKKVLRGITTIQEIDRVTMVESQ